jgi:hypothetical protein
MQRDRDDSDEEEEERTNESGSNPRLKMGWLHL